METMQLLQVRPNEATQYKRNKSLEYASNIIDITPLPEKKVKKAIQSVS